MVLSLHTWKKQDLMSHGGLFHNFREYPWPGNCGWVRADERPLSEYVALKPRLQWRFQDLRSSQCAEEDCLQGAELAQDRGWVHYNFFSSRICVVSLVSNSILLQSAMIRQFWFFVITIFLAYVYLFVPLVCMYATCMQAPTRAKISGTGVAGGHELPDVRVLGIMLVYPVILQDVSRL